VPSKTRRSRKPAAQRCERPKLQVIYIDERGERLNLTVRMEDVGVIAFPTAVRETFARAESLILNSMTKPSYVVNGER
jgi:hypothetical protein